MTGEYDLVAHRAPVAVVDDLAEVVAERMIALDRHHAHANDDGIQGVLARRPGAGLGYRRQVAAQVPRLRGSRRALCGVGVEPCVDCRACDRAQVRSSSPLASLSHALRIAARWRARCATSRGASMQFRAQFVGMRQRLRRVRSRASAGRVSVACDDHHIPHIIGAQAFLAANRTITASAVTLRAV